MSERKPGKFLVLHDIEQMPDGLYDATPRDITLLPPIKLNEPPFDYIQDIQEIAAHTQPFDITPGEKDLFGPNNDIEVQKINDPELNLKTLHIRLLNQLGIRGLAAGQRLEYEGENYNPHSTTTSSMPKLPRVIPVSNISWYYATAEGKWLTRITLGK